MLLEARSRDIHSRVNILICPTRRVNHGSDNSPIRKKYTDSSIIQRENAKLLRRFQRDFF